MASTCASRRGSATAVSRRHRRPRRVRNDAGDRDRPARRARAPRAGAADVNGIRGRRVDRARRVRRRHLGSCPPLPGPFITVAQRDAYRSATGAPHRRRQRRRALGRVRVAAPGSSPPTPTTAGHLRPRSDDRPRHARKRDVPGDGSEFTHPRASAATAASSSSNRVRRSHATRRAPTSSCATGVTGTTRVADGDARATSRRRLEPQPGHQRRRSGRRVLVGCDDARRRARRQRRASRMSTSCGCRRGRSRRVSLTSAGVQPDRGDSILPSLSADGRWIAFASTAPLDDAGRRRDRAARSRCGRCISATRSAGRTTRVTRAAESRRFPTATARFPRSAPTAGTSSFVSDASNLLVDDDNRDRRRLPLRSRNRCPQLGQPRRRRIVGRRREHVAGHLG